MLPIFIFWVMITIPTTITIKLKKRIKRIYPWNIYYKRIRG